MKSNGSLNLVNSSVSFVSFSCMPIHKFLAPLRNRFLNAFYTVHQRESAQKFRTSKNSKNTMAYFR